MILIGIGANLPSPAHGEPRATCGAALAHLAGAGIAVAQRSRWVRSRPVPESDQPWFVNAVVQVRTALGPDALMALLLETEKALGRERAERNDPRTIDLDLLAYSDLVAAPEPAGESGLPLTIPHPRMTERAFVLLPLRDIAPDWRHPKSGLGIDELIARLPPEQVIEVMADAAGAFGTEWREPERSAEPPVPEQAG